MPIAGGGLTVPLRVGVPCARTKMRPTAPPPPPALKLALELFAALLAAVVPAPPSPPPEADALAGAPP